MSDMSISSVSSVSSVSSASSAVSAVSGFNASDALKALGAAARRGRVDDCQALLDAHGPPLRNKAAAVVYPEAAEHGHTAVLEWAWRQRLPRASLEGMWNYSVCYPAAEGGHLDAFKWAVSRAEFDFWPDNCAQAAARNGHLHVVKWTYWNYGFENELEMLGAATDGEHTHVMTWLIEEEACEMSVFAAAVVAISGNLEALKKLRALGCPWDEEVCSEAARDGNLEMLQWARANGCPWGWTVTRAAEQSGNAEVLQWLLANGCPTQ